MSMSGASWSSSSLMVTSRRRRVDRRRGLVALCAAVAASLGRADGIRARFLDAVRRIVPNAAGVRLREWRAADALPDGAPDSRFVTFDVSTSDPRQCAALDVTPSPTRHLDDWDLQVLSAAGRLASVVLEIEELRRSHRHTGLRGLPAGPDGAAPLIGSTAVMRALRERIERVAVTDFTVLIEGALRR
jgi:hypothetical protein